METLASNPSRFFRHWPRLRSLTLCIALLGVTAAAGADSSWGYDWTAPGSSQRKAEVGVDSDDVSFAFTKATRRSDDPISRFSSDNVTSLFFSSGDAAAGLHFASTYSDKERSISVGTSVGPLTTFVTQGSGKRFSRNSQTYSGLNPYAFHGGSLSDYSMRGAGLGISGLGFSGKPFELQMGYVDVFSERVETRRASYVQLSGSRFFGRYTHLERGGESVGRGIDAGMRVGRAALSYQELSNKYDVSNRRIRLQWSGSGRHRYWIDVSRHSNARLAKHEDTRVMFTFQRRLGGRIRPLYAASDEGDVIATGDDPAATEEAAEPKRSKTFRNGVLIGGGAAAGILIASSGSDSQDQTDRIEAQHAAARTVLDFVNPISVRENREFGGYVYRHADGSYGWTEPIRGEAASVALPFPNFIVPAGTTATASYHTHAAFDPRFDNENFSPSDLRGDRELSIDGYLGTPAGAFKYHDVETGAVTTLGTISN